MGGCGTRPGKTDTNNARGLAESIRIRHYSPVHVSQSRHRSSVSSCNHAGRFVATLLQISRARPAACSGCDGLNMGETHRHRFDKRGCRVAAADAVPGHRRRAGSNGQAPRAGYPEERGPPAADDDPRPWADTSLAFRVTVDDPIRFTSSKSLDAHIGLTPRVRPIQADQQGG
jgi:transposase